MNTSAPPPKQESQGRESHLDAIRGRIRDWGLKRAIFWQIMHFLKERCGLYVNYVFVGGDRMDLRRPPIEIPPGYRTFFASKEDIQPFVGKTEFLDQEFIDEACANGDEITMTLYNGELVNYCFVTRVKARVSPQLEIVVPTGFRYVYKDWTRKDHRRKGVARMGGDLRATRRILKHDERSLSLVLVHNYPSLLHSYRHPSARGLKMGFVGWFKLFGREIPFHSRRAKWIGAQIRRRGSDERWQYL